MVIHCHDCRQSSSGSSCTENSAVNPIQTAASPHLNHNANGFGGCLADFLVAESGQRSGLVCSWTLILILSIAVAMQQCIEYHDEEVISLIYKCILI